MYCRVLMNWCCSYYLERSRQDKDYLGLEVVGGLGREVDTTWEAVSPRQKVGKGSWHLFCSLTLNNFCF